MQTPFTCPQCQTPFPADIHQVIDVGQNPELKQLFLSGYLNVAVCPNCQAAVRITTPLLFHDPAHELFMVHVPMELNLQHTEQQELIGQLVKQAMDALPPDQRRGYMLQPQTVLSMQTFVEKVLETEGVTPEMIARQRGQAELLESLMTADKAAAGALLKERADEIDEVFFGMLRSALETAENSGQEDRVLKLINLQARLYTETEYGRQLENQQRALRAFSNDVKQSGQLSPQILLKHVLANRSDDALVDTLIRAGQQVFNYEFFTLLTERIEKRQKSGVDTAELVALRDRLLALQQAIIQRSQEILAKAQATLQKIVTAPDREAAIQAHAGEIDDAFMYVLSESIDQAAASGQTEQADVLRSVQNFILDAVEQKSPPEVQLINRLLRAQTKEQRRQLLVEHSDLVTPEFIQVVKSLTAEAGEAGNQQVGALLQELEGLLEEQV